jgi:hypothetical protein
MMIKYFSATTIVPFDASTRGQFELTTAKSFLR